MSTFLRLDTAAFIRLKAQINLNGAFNHTLRNELRATAQVSVEIEQCERAVHATVRGGPYVNSVTLDKGNRTNAIRLARFIEASANGGSFGAVGLEVGEDDLADDMELTLRHALRLGRGTHYLPTEDLDTCILMQRTWNGSQVAVLEADDVQVQIALPRDRRAAFEVLKADVGRFLAGHRAALAA
ncbi:hypothetical protein SA496_01130 [Pseudomonas sp. JS3066]|uniref:hypothetical protein n=1 Tax=Pseudomonas sp. JS3066 TaxID=3090665 RepID=UPI002E7B1400|nr:hypothetical protein [Pseudomonas sp. JS3066]WVK93819.1 hypothetical protein SA496_01130 [Pseudomonas sp. JS3066]